MSKICTVFFSEVTVTHLCQFNEKSILKTLNVDIFNKPRPQKQHNKNKTKKCISKNYI